MLWSYFLVGFAVILIILAKIIAKPKTCKVCSMPINFDFTILDTLDGKRIINVKKNIYCKHHFIQKIRESINGFNKSFIFYEPLKYYGCDALFFCTEETLSKFNYKKEDCLDLSHLLDIASTKDEKNIIWISSEVIETASSPPLFKKKNPTYEIIDKDKFLSKLTNILLKLETSFPKGYFGFCLPYLDRGIYLWYDV